MSLFNDLIFVPPHKRKEVIIDAKELDDFLTFILNKLSELYPPVSKELTKKANLKKGLNKLERKKYKIELLLTEKKAIFEKLGAELNRVFGGTRNQLARIFHKPSRLEANSLI